MLTIVITICIAAACVSGAIIDISEDHTTTVGSPVILQCVTSSSKPVNWDFHALQLHAETVHAVYEGQLTDDYQTKTRYSVSSDNGALNLTINDTQLEDTGTYICIENGGLGPGVEAVRLTVIRKVAVIVKSTRRSTAADQKVVTSKSMLEVDTDSFVEEMKFGVDSASAASSLHGPLGQSASDNTVVTETASTASTAALQPVVDTTQRLVTQQVTDKTLAVDTAATDAEQAHDTASQLSVAVADTPIDADKSELDDVGSVDADAADAGDSVDESIVEDLHKTFSSDESDDANTAAPTAAHLVGQCVSLLVSACVSLLANLH